MSAVRIAIGMIVVASCALAACGGDDHEDHGGGERATACDQESRKDLYEPGMTKTVGALSVRILESVPAPPAKTTNSVRVAIVDASNAPVDGALVTLTPFMPDHGHGSAVVPVVTPQGGGIYLVDDVYLAMAGLWRFTISVTPAGQPAQEVAFAFCVDG